MKVSLLMLLIAVLGCDEFTLPTAPKSLSASAASTVAHRERVVERTVPAPTVAAVMRGLDVNYFPYNPNWDIALVLTYSPDNTTRQVLVHEGGLHRSHGRGSHMNEPEQRVPWRVPCPATELQRPIVLEGWGETCCSTKDRLWELEVPAGTKIGGNWKC